MNINYEGKGGEQAKLPAHPNRLENLSIGVPLVNTPQYLLVAGFPAYNDTEQTAPLQPPDIGRGKTDELLCNHRSVPRHSQLSFRQAVRYLSCPPRIQKEVIVEEMDRIDPLLFLQPSDIPHDAFRRQPGPSALINVADKQKEH